MKEKKEYYVEYKLVLSGVVEAKDKEDAEGLMDHVLRHELKVDLPTDYDDRVSEFDIHFDDSTAQAFEGIT